MMPLRMQTRPGPSCGHFLTLRRRRQKREVALGALKFAVWANESTAEAEFFLWQFSATSCA